MNTSEHRDEVRTLDAGGHGFLGWSSWAGLAILGAAGAVEYFGQGDIQRFLQSYLFAFAFFLSLGLGALFFVLVSYVMRAGWSVTIRRISEDLAASLWLALPLFVPIVLGSAYLYQWAQPETVAHDPLLQHKAAYLNVPFFSIRWAVYFAVWIGLSQFFYRVSGKQDETGDPALTLRMERVSAPGILLFSITVTFASFDLLMSLDAHWFSTIFGVYFFAGCMASFFALLAIVVITIQHFGILKHSVTVEHLHDIGKLIFAFIVFWAYIAFSQYLLIWAGNLPEETGWYARRQEGDWMWASLALLVGHFALPFLFLMSKHIKRRKALLAVAALWVLAMHAFDLYWIIMPQKQFDASGRIPFHVFDLICLVGFGLLFFAATKGAMRRRSLIPEKDPRLHEALAFEVDH